MASTETVPIMRTAVLPASSDTGAPIFALLAKRTYDLVSRARCVPAETQRALLEADVYYDGGTPEDATVLYESDLVPFKVATDIVVIGKARVPHGRQAYYLDVAVQAGAFAKQIRVVGDRWCSHRPGLPPVFTEPQPFAEIEIRYEHAYGGQDWKSDPALPFFYPRNFMGRGIAVRNTRETIEGLRLPNLEDPHDMLAPERVVLEDPDRWNDQPLPQGFGWFQKTWYPRCSFVGIVPGTMDPDTMMREEMLGLVPRRQVALSRQRKLPSWDVRFNNGASPGLAVPHMNGDELFRLTGLTDTGVFDFALAGERPRMMMNIGLGENELQPVLHSVCVRVDDGQVDLVWRGAHEYPGIDWLPEMKCLETQVDWP
jgi:hypothetical protein